LLEQADADGSESRRDFFWIVRRRFGLTEPLDRLVHDYRRDTLSHFRLEKATADALRMLRQAGYKTGIATNGVRVQVDKIRHVGLDALVDGWAVSDLVGASKPEPYIFQVLAKVCGASLRDAWVVGDRPEADIAGAAAIGARSVLIRHGSLWQAPSRYRPTHVADNVAEAAQLIMAHTP
jgi:putative hydrolase of the HAD superfamily